MWVHVRICFPLAFVLGPQSFAMIGRMETLAVNTLDIPCMLGRVRVAQSCQIVQLGGLGQSPSVDAGEVVPYVPRAQQSRLSVVVGARLHRLAGHC
jgi:hypothetical protein